MILRWELCWCLVGIFATLINIDAAIVKQVASFCPNITACEFNEQQCNEDEDCNSDSVCCNSPCGKVCVKQLLTGCETLRQSESRRAKSLGVSDHRVRKPRCSKNGGFESIQCDNEIVSSCWCVDEAGLEKPGTRAPAVALVNCTAPNPCADHTCRMFCPYGFALTEEGCPLCRCRDPCENVKCPKSLECRTEELACSNPPCPPIPTCKRGRSLESVCPLGDPLRISDTIRPFLCGTDPGKPSCPPLYQCLVQSGHDYGVCCPASLKIQKSGTCSADGNGADRRQCGILCNHDLECPSVQKCCQTMNCGLSCTYPANVTECTHQRTFSEILSVNERMGRGYIPQCSIDGEFEPKQCSRNGLVCWCVDRSGRKIGGSMGPAETVTCSMTENFVARSLSQSSGGGGGERCSSVNGCAAICEYGFQMDETGCPTCTCDDPCNGYKCEADDEECTNVKDATCTDFLCPVIPVCRSRLLYNNPCAVGAPLTDESNASPIECNIGAADECPTTHQCTAVAGSSSKALCCPQIDTMEAEATDDDQRNVAVDRPQTMCEYLRDFSDSMEGTQDGMVLAIPSPRCSVDGDYLAMQCHNDECWCVDHFGTEIPRTRRAPMNANSSIEQCTQVRVEMECLDLTCRMGCEYGFVLSEENGCPQCQCRDPCSAVTCGEHQQCQLVEVSCKDNYCPPVPACLPRKQGQCPYLIPTASITCDFECNTDMSCNATKKCCSNGCGTQCVEPLLLTMCQHRNALALYQAHETGIPASKLHIPSCDSEGAFNAKQCNAQECWCVNSDGQELEKSRRTASTAAALNCTLTDALNARSECPMRKCKANCEHGYRMEKGSLCRTCDCIDPCDGIRCRGEGESCRLVPVECISSPCPSIPMCLPKKENPCQDGEPLIVGGEVVTCGPDFEVCPSSHKCQLSPIGEYAVCCPKPRDVCFEPLHPGQCVNRRGPTLNTTRYYFNAKSNRCEMFTYVGCDGNHNNFHSKAMCTSVCPVLSQCERLREKNARSAVRLKKATFLPRCEPNTGAWMAVQCLQHVHMCWCVNPLGQPIKGTLTRGGKPRCNFRQARQRANARSDSAAAAAAVDDPAAIPDADIILQELMTLIGSMHEIEMAATGDGAPTNVVLSSDADGHHHQIGGEVAADDTTLIRVSRCLAFGGQCDGAGKFLPTQCEEDTCWCVDEAGNQLPHTNSFQKGHQLCKFTPIDSVEVAIGFRGIFDRISSIRVTEQIQRIVSNLKGTISSDGVQTDITSDSLHCTFVLTGSNKVDVAYIIEQMVVDQRLSGLVADITRSRVTHNKHAMSESEHHQLLVNDDRNKLAALKQREIVSQSPVSLVAPYHTALIVIAAASAFVISILLLLVVLHKRKTISHLYVKQTLDQHHQPCLTSARRPIYIELPKDSYKPLSDHNSVDK